MHDYNYLVFSIDMMGLPKLFTESLWYDKVNG